MIAYILFIGLNVATVFATKYGLGIHIWDVDYPRTGVQMQQVRQACAKPRLNSKRTEDRSYWWIGIVWFHLPSPISCLTRLHQALHTSLLLPPRSVNLEVEEAHMGHRCICGNSGDIVYDYPLCSVPANKLLLGQDNSRRKVYQSAALLLCWCFSKFDDRFNYSKSALVDIYQWVASGKANCHVG